MVSHPFTDKDRVDMNKHLKTIEEIQKHIDMGKDANIPGMDELQKRCVYCKDNIVAMKQAYFKGKP